MKIIYETIIDRIRDAVRKADTDGKKIKKILVTTDEAMELRADPHFMMLYPFPKWFADECKRCGEPEHAHRWGIFAACHRFVPRFHGKIFGVEVDEE